MAEAWDDGKVMSLEDEYDNFWKIIQKLPIVGLIIQVIRNLRQPSYNDNSPFIDHT